MTQVTISLDTLTDLISMAEQSPQYRAGYAWTAVAMVEARRAEAAADKIEDETNAEGAL